MLGKVDKNKIPYDDYCKIMYRRSKILNVVKVFVLIAIWTPLVIYYFSPFSKSNIVSIKGNALNFNDDYIYSCTDINKDHHIWNVVPSNIEKQLLNHPYCNNAKVDLTFSGIKITIDEIKVVAKNNDKDDVTYYLSNGSSKLYSSIKDSINDPLSTDFKFLKPYIDDLPTIDEKQFKNDEFDVVLNDLGRLDNELIKMIKEVKVNEKSTSFTLVSLIVDKEVFNIENDLIINVDYRDIDKLVNKEIIETCINKIKQNNKQYYNVLLENDIENKYIKIVPYGA